jgi:hypothetical protein
MKGSLVCGSKFDDFRENHPGTSAIVIHWYAAASDIGISLAF